MSTARFVKCEFCNNRTEGCEQCIGKKLTYQDIDWREVNRSISEEMHKIFDERNMLADFMKGR